MQSRTSWLLLIAWTAAIGGILGVGACGDAGDTMPDDGRAQGEAPSALEVQTKADSLCRAAGSCEPADPGFVDACLSVYEEQVAAAEAHDCLGVLEAWIECLTDSSSCSPEGEFTDQGACNEQEELAEDCRGGLL